MAQVRCPSCSKLCTLADQHLGRTVRCRACQAKFTAVACAEEPEPQVEETEEVLTVVARWVGDPNAPGAPGATAIAPPPARLSRGMLIAAVSLALIPVLASGFGVAWSVVFAGTHSVYAGIEIGSKGVKLLVLNVFFNRHGDFEDVDIQADDQTNTGLGESLGSNGLFGRSAVEDTVGAIARYREQAIKDFKVPPDQIFIVGASGLFAKLKDRKIPDAARQQYIAANKALLNEVARERFENTVQYISVDDEASQSFESAVPDRYALGAAFFDLGSGSIKAAVKTSERSYLTLEVPMGLTELTKRIDQQRDRHGQWSDEARRLAPSILGSELKKRLDSKNAFRNREHIYLAGGISWALATFAHPEDRGAFVKLRAEDLDRFAHLASLDKDAASAEILAAAKGDSTAAEEVRKVLDTFKQDQLIAGAELVRTLWKEVPFDGRQVYFPRYGRLSWILAYIKHHAVVR